MKTNPPLFALRHHVTGAIERGEKTAIAGQPAAGEAANAPTVFDRFGTHLTLQTKPDGSGWIKCISHYETGDKAHEIHISDTRAEGGSVEIARVLETLPDFPVPPLPWPATPEEAKKVRRCYVCNCDTTEREQFSKRRKPARVCCSMHAGLACGDRARLEEWRSKEQARAALQSAKK